MFGTPALKNWSADWLTVQRRWAGPKPQRSAFAASSLYVTNRLSAHGRAAEVELLRHRHEISQLTQLHHDPIHQAS